MPVQDMQEAAQSQGDLSDAEKAENKKAKKARQRAARAQAVAQTGQVGQLRRTPLDPGFIGKDLSTLGLKVSVVRCGVHSASCEGSMLHMGSQCKLKYAWQAEDTRSKELELSEGTSGASEQDTLADVHVSDPPPEAVHLISDSMFAAPKSPSAHSTPAHSSEDTAGSGSSSVSPQPLLHPHDGMLQGQQGGDGSNSAAQGAQAPGPAAQEEGHWQQVRTYRRRKASQQTASEAGTCNAPSRGRAAPDQKKLAQPQPCPVHLQAAPQRPKQALPRSEKAAVPPYAQPAPEASTNCQHLPEWLSGLAGSKPQQPSQHEAPDTMLYPRPQAPPLSIQHEIFQTASAGDSSDEELAPEEAVHRSLHSENGLHEQVCIMSPPICNYLLNCLASSDAAELDLAYVRAAGSVRP